jgi:ribosomal protein L28
MSRRCEVTGAVPVLGHRIIRSGKSKKSGGIDGKAAHIGKNTNAKVARTFFGFK